MFYVISVIIYCLFFNYIFLLIIMIFVCFFVCFFFLCFLFLCFLMTCYSVDVLILASGLIKTLELELGYVPLPITGVSLVRLLI